MRPSPRMVAPEMPRIDGDLRADRLHDDLAAADQLVGDERRRMLAGAHQDHRQRRVGLGQHRRAAAEERAEVLEAVGAGRRTRRSAAPRRGAARSRVRGRRATPSTVATGSAYSSSCTRTISACVIASVNGRRIVKRVPWPGVDSMNSAPPSFFTSVATTSMPTPRPACCVRRSAVLKPGSRISCSASSSVSSWLGPQQAHAGAPWRGSPRR